MNLLEELKKLSDRVHEYEAQGNDLSVVDEMVWSDITDIIESYGEDSLMSDIVATGPPPLKRMGFKSF